jgi:trimethylamine--corrinoid protein Co-methyltransferase
MVHIAMGGNDFLKENHCVALGVDPLSPLSYESVACETIIEFARQRQPIFFTVAVMAGFTGPIDLIGTVLLQNAECLAGMTLAQLINPGSPVIYSTGSTVANMKNGTFATGSPEMMLIQLAGIQLGRDYYRLPTRSMCGMTDSKIVDYQAGYETMQNLIIGVLGGAHLIFECLGVLDAIMTTSYEKLILDLEIISRVMRIREGMDAGEKEQALASIQAVGPGGSFVTHIDTLTRYRDRWQPTLSNWESYENWRKAGGEDVVVKANRKYKEMLAAAPESLLDPGTDKALRKFIHQCLQQ